jgi:beta-glucuronidase
MDEIVTQLKELGANSTRAHYPLNERLLDRFDEAGILVWNQAPIYHRNRELNTPEGRREALDTVRGTILAGRNHASVVTHSVANEPVSRPDDYPGSAAFLRGAARLSRRLDPTLPVSVDILTYPRIPEQETYKHFDLLGINNYYGWYVGKPDHPTGNFYDLEPYLQRTHERYPEQAMVMTEYGAESTTNGPVTEKGTYEFQVDYINRVLDVVERNEFMGGAIYWTLREFAVKPRWTGGAAPWAEPLPDSIHNKALIAYDGWHKPAFGLLRDRIARALAPPLPPPQPEPAPEPAPVE